MKIEKKLNGSSLEVAVEGRLDTMTAPELEKELKDCLKGVKELIFDFGKLEYVSSAGLRVLLIAQRSMEYGGKMWVRNANELIREVFEVTGFADIITVE